MIYYHQKGQCWRGKEEEQRRPEREGLKEGNGHEPLQSEAWFRCGEAHAEYHGDERDWKEEKEEENGGRSRSSSTVVVEFQIATGCTRQGH